MTASKYLSTEKSEFSENDGDADGLSFRLELPVPVAVPWQWQWQCSPVSLNSELNRTASHDHVSGPIATELCTHVCEAQNSYGYGLAMPMAMAMARLGQDARFVFCINFQSDNYYFYSKSNYDYLKLYGSSTAPHM